jgi:hypothetical protein
MSNPRIEVDFAVNVAGVAKGVTAATSQLDKLGAAAQSTAPKVEQLGKATKSYNAIGVDFSRIIQDAPFGIIGVGNNIQQLAFSFQELRNTSTSTASALKQAFVQIISPGNLLFLSISLITSALTAYKMGVFDSKEETKDLEKETETYDQTLRKVIDSLGAVQQARIEGSKGTADELVKLDLLNKALNDSNQPQSTRIAAYKKLKEEYPTILSNITQEQALANGLGDAYLKVVSAITQRASAIAIEEKLVDLAKQRFDIIQKEQNEVSLQNSLLKQREDLLGKISERGVQINKNGTTLAQIFGDRTVDFALVDLGNGIINVNKELNLLGNVVAPKTQSELVKNSTATSQLKNEFFNLNLELTDFFQLSEKSSKSNNILKRSLEEIQNIDFKLPKISFDIPKQSFGVVNLENIQSQIQGLQSLEAQLKGTGVNVQQFYAAIANGAAEGFDSLDSFISSLSDTQNFINETFNILEQGAENTLGDMAFAIGDALASGGNVIKAAGGALLGGLAGILNQLGQLAIATGLAVEGIKTALKTLNPAVAIGAGVALIALAGFVSNKAKSLGGSKGSGGGVSSVGSSGVGGGTSFAGGGQGGLFQQNKELNGELVVRGQDLVYVFAQANNKINKG